MCDLSTDALPTNLTITDGELIINDMLTQIAFNIVQPQALHEQSDCTGNCDKMSCVSLFSIKVKL